jgi:hypothetical protein
VAAINAKLVMGLATVSRNATLTSARTVITQLEPVNRNANPIIHAMAMATVYILALLRQQQMRKYILICQVREF